MERLFTEDLTRSCCGKSELRMCFTMLYDLKDKVEFWSCH